jgi:thymidylate synthase
MMGLQSRLCSTFRTNKNVEMDTAPRSYGTAIVPDLFDSAVRYYAVVHMAEAHFSGETLDDAMRSAIEAIRAHGERINPTKGPALELTGVLLEITDARARLSRTETRGKPYSCLGELCWYLANSNDVSFISYYLPEYRKSADDNTLFGAYGPRLFNWRGVNQFGNVARILKEKRDSRQAVVQLFDAHDVSEVHRDVPCTCTLQFMIRRDRLHLIAYMRSNDAFWGLPHDVFCFTMLQEIMARDLSVELGAYKHSVGSLHLYEKHVEGALRFLNEGWQPTEAAMPAMPVGDPWPGVASMLDAEYRIRSEGIFDRSKLEEIDPYWADLIRLLNVFRCKREKDPDTIRALRESMSSNIYFPFINKVLSQLRCPEESMPPAVR